MLLEIIVATGIAVLLVTGLVAATSASLRTSQYGQRRTSAIKYAQEGIETTRSLRDQMQWSQFIALDTSAAEGTFTTRCLDKNGVLTLGPCLANIDSLYTRSISFDSKGSLSRMDVSVVVLWQEGGLTPDVKLTTYFTQWR